MTAQKKIFMLLSPPLARSRTQSYTKRANCVCDKSTTGKTIVGTIVETEKLVSLKGIGQIRNEIRNAVSIAEFFERGGIAR
jgi:hypothetical protein